MQNKILIGVFILLFVSICGFAQVFVSKYQDKLDTIDALEKAKNEAIAAQKAGEATIQGLRRDNEKLQVALAKWKDDYAEANSRAIAASKQISCLEAENEEIRTVLHTAIPDDVWRVLFPKGTGNTCTNKD